MERKLVDGKIFLAVLVSLGEFCLEAGAAGGKERRGFVWKSHGWEHV